MRIKKFENFDTKENAEDIFEEFIEQYRLKGWVVSKHTKFYGHNLIPIYFAEFETQKQIWYSVSDNKVEIFFIKTDFDYEISQEDSESIYSDFSNINKRMKKFGFDVTEPEWMNVDSFYSEEMGRGGVEGECLYFEY